MNTDTVWGTAVEKWEKEVGPLIEIHKVLNSWDDDMKTACRFNLMNLDSIDIPGEKSETRKKDF
jgi:hypothetical protein